jgi:hypothetical protein
MARCGMFSGHKLSLTASARIVCDKCRAMWDLDGMELVPLGYKSWQAWSDHCIKMGLTPGRAPESVSSRTNPLPPRDIAMTLANDAITRNFIKDRAQIDALRHQASKDPLAFISAVRGR